VYVRFSLPLRNVEDLPFERGINICLETMRFRWNRFGPLFAGHPAPAGEPGGRLLALAMTPGRDEREAEGRRMTYLWGVVNREGDVLES
jgi:putative transposase